MLAQGVNEYDSACYAGNVKHPAAVCHIEWQNGINASVLGIAAVRTDVLVPPTPAPWNQLKCFKIPKAQDSSATPYAPSTNHNGYCTGSDQKLQ